MKNKAVRKSEVIISLGSNVNQEQMIELAKKSLRELFNDDVTFTESLWTEPVGITSDRFLNCLCFAYTYLELKTVCKRLKEIEQQCGRTRENLNCNKVCLDLDILKYETELLHKKDWTRRYVKELVKECPFK